MSSAVTDKRQRLTEAARAFATEHLDPIAESLDEHGVFPAGSLDGSGTYPKPIIERLAAQGFLGLLLPEASGGGDVGFVGYTEVVEALSRSVPSVASILNNHSLAAYAIARWGSEKQKKQYLPRMATGEQLGAVAIYEHGPTLGIGPDALLAARRGDGFVLAGTKAFVRNAGVAEVYVVLATLEPVAEEKHPAVFIVDAKSPGLTVAPHLETMGLKGCPVAHMAFGNLQVGEDALLGDESSGSLIAHQLLSIGSVAEAAQTVGIGNSAALHAAAFARRRVQFGHPIANLQAIQTLMAEVATDSHLAWLGVQNASKLIDDGAPFETEAAMVKSFLVRFGSNLLINACQVEGGLGIAEMAPPGIHGFLSLARLFRDIAGTTLLDAPADFPDKLIAESLG